jgi:hypothetical protein
MLQVALVFTLGCSVLVCNAVLCILPLIPGLRLKLPEGVIYVEGVLSVLSCSLFLLGSTFAFFEALQADENAIPGFGSQMQGVCPESTQAYEEDDFSRRTSIDEQYIPVVHYNMNWNNSHADLFHHFASNDESLSTPGEMEKLNICPLEKKRATRTRRIRSKYLHLRIFASTVFLCSSALYFATSLASLITIIQSGTIARCIRYPQLVAAAGFAIASVLLIIKIQKDSIEPWWHIKLKSVGIHLNFWNFVGSIGFIFCAYFGMLEHPWAQQQFGYSYLWGSWAFLFGSVLQWYRTLHRKEPVVEGWKTEKSAV